MPALPASLKMGLLHLFLELEWCYMLLETLLEDSPAKEPELTKVRGACAIFWSRAIDLDVNTAILWNQLQIWPLVLLIPAITQFSTFSSNCRAVLC